jgi:signal transduction histidine kinase
MDAASTPRREVRGVLGAGFGASIVLAVVLGGLSFVESRLVHEDVTQLVAGTEHSTVLVAEIGRQVTRLLSVALERGVDDGPDEARTAQLAAADRALESAIGELTAALQVDRRAQAPRLVPLLTELRGQVRTALDAAERSANREAAIARLGALARLLQDELDVLDRMTTADSRTQLEAVDARLGRMSDFQLGIDVLLLLGLVLIWSRVVRTLQRQRAELTRYTARIEQSNRDLDAFAGRIAHDLRDAISPLSLIGGELRRTPQPSALDRVADRLDAAIRRARALLDGLLAFSRAARPAVPATPTDVRQTVAAVLEELAPLAAEVGAAVDVRVSEVRVPCAAPLLHTVVANLVRNALKFLADRPERRVRITARARGDIAELVVEDTGPGIPRDSVARIFEPFFRVPGAAAPGTGIGLATVRRIVEAHAGSIDVESRVGRGTTLRVWLPLALPDAADAASAQPFPADTPAAR